ncbi:hypothetical protein ACTRW9_02350 [Nitrospina sp. 32_T5]|uniref:hypothetical protein n=1 Tax=unclassified Nitrospina TaxID=2638683 RepID=UPI003F953676
MDPYSANELSRIILDIQGYLEKHPRASDTPEGVMHWLARQRYENMLELVGQALERLVQEGVMEKRKMPDGRWVYSLGHEGPRPAK